MPTLLEAFDGLPFPRMERTQLHTQRDIAILSILAVICGADGFVQIEDFGKAKEDWLGKVLDLPNGIPSHDTIGRVFSLLDPETYAKRGIKTKRLRAGWDHRYLLKILGD